MEHRQEGPASWFADASEVADIGRKARRNGAGGQGRQAERSRAGNTVHQCGVRCLGFVRWSTVCGREAGRCRPDRVRGPLHARDTRGVESDRAPFTVRMRRYAKTYAMRATSQIGWASYR